MNPLLQQAAREGYSRREFLRNLLFTAGSISAASWLSGCGDSSSSSGASSVSGAPVTRSPFADIGPLLEPDANGIRLPAGFSSRVLAVVNQPPLVSNPGFLWHADPDGAGTFRTDDGGWIVVSNAEARDSTTGGAVNYNPLTSRETAEALGLLRGGVSALRFDADGNLVDAYPCQRNTTTNCSGGPTPWGTWIHGEEIVDGYMFECSPLRDGGEPVRLDCFGRKGHEMVAVHVAERAIYHTEDVTGEDRFYRTIFPASAWPEGGRPDWSQGILQVLVVEGGSEAAVNSVAPIRWVDAINDGRPQSEVYLPETTIFAGNEGCWVLDGFVFFSTKSDDRIWAIDTIGLTIESVYDPTDGPVGSPVDPDEPQMFGVDNITMTLDGEMVVVEDGGDMRAMMLLPDRTTIPLLRLPGDPDVTEVTGPTFSPDGRRLYVANQRALEMGAPASFGTGGVVYEITMPFSVRVSPPLAQPL